MRYTNRGFKIYGSLKDDRNNSVRVQESSEVGKPRCWVFAHNAEGEDSYIHLGKPQSVSPYLTKKQAAKLVEILLRFVGKAKR